MRRFLADVKPFIRVKATQFRLLLEYLKQRSTYQGVKDTPVQEVALREAFYWAFKEANGTL